MQKIKTTILIMNLLAGFVVKAQLMDVNIVVLNTEGKKFTLYVNDSVVNSQPEVNVKAFHINEGWCRLKAEFENDKIVANDSIKIKAIEKNNYKEITLTINQILKNGTKSAKFEFLTIGDASGPQKPVVPEIPVYLSKLTENAVFGNLYQIKDKKPDFFKNFDSASAKCQTVLTDKDVEHFLFLISQTNDFSNRALFTQKTVLHNCYSSSQLIKILNTMDIELEKLKLAKKANNHLTDKVNEKSIVSVFKFKTMSEDYLSFLNQLTAEKNQKSLHCNTPVSESLFNDLYVQVIKGKYEHDKYDNAKKIVLQNCFTTSQIKKIVEIFSHDREKLELAKMAFPVAVDKENYKSMSDSFMFSENKNDFLNFISK
jgi:hypothetical protein